MSAPDPWEQISERKKKEQQARIPEEWKVAVPADLSRPLDLFKDKSILSGEELQWTDPSNDALTTLAFVSSGSVTAEQLITAFCKRAAIAHAATNCLTEITFDAAIQRAKTLDEHFRNTGKVVGPLHGLPISVKDHMNVEGVDSSMGFSSLCFDPAKQNGKLVQVLVDQGAVVIAKTNIPQTAFTADSDNLVFGRTLNPYNSKFGASGSSGGEGALIAMGGSLLGLASDGSGSIRMPSAANGVVGYKPSGYRLPSDGRPVFDYGMMGIVGMGPVGVFGFMGRSIRDIRAFAKLVCEQRIWDTDPFLYPSPWIGIDTPRPRIGVWTVNTPNSYIHLHPPVKRGFLVAQDRLRHAGYELVEFQNPDISSIWEFQRDWLGIQGLSTLRKFLGNEPLTNIAAKTNILKYEQPTTLTVKYLHEMNMKLAGLVMAMTSAWSASGKPLDALLWVNSPHTAMPWDTWMDTTCTAVFNCIDWPAVALPLGIMSDMKIDVKEDFVPWNEMDAQIQSIYDAESFDGLPLAVQLIGRRFEDEKLLGIAEQVHPILLGQ
ncbi:amidase signature domain-containing protein [Rhexocercosporidium sp. MPI-PUGE-AT-0058]|nr:amidase signature domain-containing protein [Rhexocercosporidium sp. MPI-PUGE-AT-0058]